MLPNFFLTLFLVPAFILLLQNDIPTPATVLSPSTSLLAFQLPSKYIHCWIPVISDTSRLKSFPCLPATNTHCNGSSYLHPAVKGLQISSVYNVGLTKLDFDRAPDSYLHPPSSCRHQETWAISFKVQLPRHVIPTQICIQQKVANNRMLFWS